MANMEKFLPPAPDDLVDGVFGLVQDVADRAHKLSENDPLAVVSSIVSKTARHAREDLQ